MNRRDEYAVVERVDKDVIDRATGGREEILNEIMGHRPWRLDAFEFESDGVGLADTDPDRQEGGAL